ncbi:MAG: hypothetical protein DHS20C14_05270 [Phycisphaeraceae bacterium]|nr:MAG: hypothetical protein DHS20C14_05270 [Phycisphaeraceae bacterium]
MNTRTDTHLAAYLATHDEPCPVCSYNLRGIAQPTCPECAAELRLTVASAQTRTGPWLLAVIAAALALGFDAVVTVILGIGNTIAFVNQGTLTRSSATLFGLFVGFTVVSAVVMAVLLRRRREWVRLSLRRQWALGWGVFAAIGLAHVGFAVLLISVL